MSSAIVVPRCLHAEIIFDDIWSKLFLSPLERAFSHSWLLLNLTGAELGATGDAGKTQDRQTENGIRCVGSSGGDAQPSLFLSLLISFLYSASFLYLYSLRPSSFTVL
jgi:hypothetical protein